MKVIFLDIDGVVSSARIGWFTYDQYAVNFINYLCKEHDFQVVISSTWRKNNPKEFFDKYFTHIHEDWRTIWLYKDESGNRYSRGHEIKEWLNRHSEIEDYLILDDDTDFLEEQKHRFVQTDSLNGLLVEHMMQINEMFNINVYGRLYNQEVDE